MGKFGRYCYQKLPFGTCSAPEVCHRVFKEVYEELDGVEVYIDNIIVWGNSDKQYNEWLDYRPNKSGLNEAKYLGHIFSSQGVKPDNEKISTIFEIEESKTKKEVQIILRMVTYVSKFLPNLANVTDQCDAY